MPFNLEKVMSTTITAQKRWSIPSSQKVENSFSKSFQGICIPSSIFSSTTVVEKAQGGLL